jgi:DNA-directed RNA polymerase specialized sigma24 family protein
VNHADEAGRAAERVARESYGRLVAFLAARTRDVAGAEDALSEAFAEALRTWPVDGAPENPHAWLLTVARRRQTDAIRRRQTRTAGEEHLRRMADELAAAADEGETIPDRRLALMFACAHPAIERGMRAPLILQTILGLTAVEAAFMPSRCDEPWTHDDFVSDDFVATSRLLSGLSYRNTTAMPASATGSDQAQSPTYVTAIAAATQPPKKPTRR